jgi:uncharacterized protein YjdB
MPTVVFGSNNTDIEGHWAQTAIQTWIDSGYVSGYSDGTFKPDEAITRAEFVTLINNVVDLQATSSNGFSDVSNNDWYADVVDKVKANGLISGYSDGTFKPNEPITRAEGLVVINKLLALEGPNDYSMLLQYKDGNSTAEWAKEAAENLLEKHYLSGYTDGTLRLSKNITRAETVALLKKVFGYILNDDSKMSKEFDGNVTIAKAGVTLSNATINGDLYIAEGVGEGDVTLEDVNVAGDIIVKGGGENSLHFNNVIGEKEFIIEKMSSTVHIVVTGDTNLPKTILKSSAILDESGLTGDGFGDVSVLDSDNGPRFAISLNGGFNAVSINRRNTRINLKSGTIRSVNVGINASDCGFDGNGDITDLNIFANNIIVNLRVHHYQVGSNVDGTEINGKDIAGGTDSTSGQNSGGSTSSDGSSSSDSSDSSDDSSTSNYYFRIAESKLNIDFTTGSAYTLNYSAKAGSDTNPEIVWTSSDESVATVSTGGVVTVHSVGVTVITGTISGRTDSYSTDSCTVIVSDYSDDSDYYFRISQESVSMETTSCPAYTLTFSAKAGSDTNPEITWTSSDESVATVSADGVITAHSAGTATITGTLYGTADNCYTDTCTVTVSDELARLAKYGFASVPVVDYLGKDRSCGDMFNISFALKDASDSNPCRVYMIMDYNINKDIITAKDISEGHGPVNEFVVDSSKYADWINITDNKTHTVCTTSSSYCINFTYNGNISDTNVDIAFAVENADGTLNAPYVMNVSKDSREVSDNSVYMYCERAVDRNYMYLGKDTTEVGLIVSPAVYKNYDNPDLNLKDDFVFTGANAGATIDSVEMDTVNSDGNNFTRFTLHVSGYTVDENNYTGIKLGNIENDFVTQDTSKILQKYNSETVVLHYEDSPVFEDEATVSSDRSKIYIDVYDEPVYNISLKDLTISYSYPNGNGGTYSGTASINGIIKNAELLTKNIWQHEIYIETGLTPDSVNLEDGISMSDVTITNVGYDVQSLLNDNGLKASAKGFETEGDFDYKFADYDYTNDMLSFTVSNCSYKDVLPGDFEISFDGGSTWTSLFGSQFYHTDYYYYDSMNQLTTYVFCPNAVIEDSIKIKEAIKNGDMMMKFHRHYDTKFTGFTDYFGKLHQEDSQPKVVNDYD